MQHNQLLKYILDIEAVISEMEELLVRYKNNFLLFEKDFMAKRTVERHLEIIGEAVNKMHKIDPSIEISSVKQIVGLRNLIIHSYDSVHSGVLWAIIQRDIPMLKEELKRMRS